MVVAHVSDKLSGPQHAGEGAGIQVSPGSGAGCPVGYSDFGHLSCCLSLSHTVTILCVCKKHLLQE